MTPGGAAFDGLAAGYDDGFTRRPIGRALRAAVWRHVDPRVRPGTAVLDVGCGTGEDAAHLARLGARVVAFDASGEMVRVARRKVDAAGLRHRVWLAARDAGDLGVGDGPLVPGAPHVFDGALADFGVLNCLTPAALGRLGAALAACLRPGGWFVAVVLGPWCAWETAWHLARLDLARAWRRRRPGGAHADLGAGPFVVRYPPPVALAHQLGSGLRLVDRVAVGSLLPPTYAAAWLERSPRALAALAAADRRVERAGWASAIADQYLAVFEAVARP